MPRVASHGLDAVAVTANDSTTYDPPLQSIYIGTGGNLVITTLDGQDVTYTNLPDGSWLPVKASKVKATSTTASGLIGHY